MEGHRKKIAIGIITYGKATYKYLPYFLENLSKQVFRDFNVYAVDNTETEKNDNSDLIKAGYPEISLEWPGKNIGFARAYNRMIRKAIADGAEYFLALNIDILMERDMITRLIKSIESDKRIGAVQPKILKWDFENHKKTDIIDSLGVKIGRNHRFMDMKQGRIDDKTAEETEIFGVTGAAALFRLDALKDISYNTEFFDELMFMYKEDCDLSYRLRLAGWKLLLSPEAVCYHDRTAVTTGESLWQALRNRKNKSRRVRAWSFYSQWVIFFKYKKLPYSAGTRVATRMHQLRSLLYAIFFEPFLIKQFCRLKKTYKEIVDKRNALKIKADIRDIEKLMH